MFLFSAQHWSNVSFSSHFLFSRHLTGQVRKQDFSNTKKTDPSHSLSHLFFFHTCLPRSTVLLYTGSSHHQFNKSDQQNHFQPWLPYSWTLQTAVGVWVVRLFCISNTWWSFNVRVESPSGTVKTAVCDAAHVCPVMMNGCLVCWFYGVLVVRFTRGRRARVGRELKGGVNRGDVQLTVVTLCQSSCPSEDMREP